MFVRPSEDETGGNGFIPNLWATDLRGSSRIKKPSNSRMIREVTQKGTRSGATTQIHDSNDFNPR